MKIAQSEADGVFLRAFDVTIEQVHGQLAAAGLDEKEIWAAFRRATSKMAELSTVVESEDVPRFSLRPVARTHRRAAISQ